MMLLSKFTGGVSACLPARFHALNTLDINVVSVASANRVGSLFGGWPPPMLWLNVTCTEVTDTACYLCISVLNANAH